MKPVRFPFGTVRFPFAFILIMALFLGLFFSPGQALTARADTAINVTTFVDETANDGHCSLREAMIAANTDKQVNTGPGECPQGSGTDTINLPAGTYTLTKIDAKTASPTTGDLDVASNMTINGAGADKTFITGVNFSDRIFKVVSGNSVFTDFTVSGSTLSSDGSGIFNQASLTLNRVVITGNNASGRGGGIFNTSNGVLLIQNSTIWGNQAQGSGGGGLAINSGTVTIYNSTISGNLATKSGGGIYQNGGTVTLNNVTVANNIADSDANGTGDGGGVSVTSGTFNFANTILAGNLDKSSATIFPDCNGKLISQNYNLIGNPAGCTISGKTTGNRTGAPQLGELQNNGGTTPTQALLSGSPALNNGNPAIPGSEPAACLATDQRGVDRKLSLPGDIGAFELNKVKVIISGDLKNGTIDIFPTGDLSIGDKVTLTALPNPGYAFSNWTGSLSGDTNPITVTLTGDLTVGATFGLAIQGGPVFTVNETLDEGGTCYVLHCNLRQAILAANSHPNGLLPDQIEFKLGDGAHQFSPASALPTIIDPVVIDGTSVPGQSITIDGSIAIDTININDGNPPQTIDGLTITGGGSTLKGLTITHFSGNGVAAASSGNLIKGNTITLNGKAGILVQSGFANKILSNTIFGNGSLGIDLGSDGVTPNDTGDIDAGPNYLQNFPVLTAAIPDPSNAIQGRLNSTPGIDFTLEFYANDSCDPSGFGEGQYLLGSKNVTTDESGNATFSVDLEAKLEENHFVTATATDAAGNTSEFSQCIISSAHNDIWPRAFTLISSTDLDTVTASIDQYLDKQGQVRWYKFKVNPNNKVIITLTNLPENYDLTLYKDIGEAFEGAATTDDLLHQGAEFAPDAYSPDAYSPDAYSPDAYSPDAYSPDAYSADIFSPGSASPATYSPDAYSPDAYSPDAMAPDAYSPDAYSPDAYSPDAYSPDASSGMFANAQTRSLIAVSAFDGTAPEGIAVNTWENSGYFYVRVRGRNGVYSLAAPFHLEVTESSGQCKNINPPTEVSNVPLRDGNFKTIILTDMARMQATDADKTRMNDLLTAFANRQEVNGVVVDVHGDAAVLAANSQADAHPACPSAKNLVANAIRDIVIRAGQKYSLEYVVIIGDDSVIPFFRHPDESLLASEQNFVPPVIDSSPSQASLKLGYYLSQDDYGSRLTLSSNLNTFTVPTLAVGRLVETPAQIETMLNAYLAISDPSLTDPATAGVVNPTSALVTGYDFLADSAAAIQGNLQNGLGVPVKALITPKGISPADPRSWTASDLRTELLGSRNDLAFLGGHFSSGSALAADYSTRLFASEVADSSTELTNSIIFSAGCHAGYNVVDADGIPMVTLAPDWPQAFASKGATLIAGSGYQYGDTDFIMYSEQLYMNFSQQLLVGEGPVPVGKALVRAKQDYLANTVVMRGIDEKAVLESTLFGLPMLRVNMPHGRFTPVSKDPIVSGVTGFTSDPGASLGLTYADVSIPTKVTITSIELKDPAKPKDYPRYTAVYGVGDDGVVSLPNEPVLPLDVSNVTVPGTVLRGVGFRGGKYADLANVLPFTGATTTELRSAHTPFYVDFFYPIRFWSVNYFDALTGGGQTQLMLEPSQYMSTIPGSDTGTLRTYNEMGFRLFYSDYTTSESGYSPALSAAPTISTVSSTVSGSTIHFQERVVGDPAAGVQQVWVTYTTLSTDANGEWRTIDLVQNELDSTLWEGNLEMGGANQEDFRYIVQAVNGVGLVSMATNLGAYYIPGYESATPTEPTNLSLTLPPTEGAYGTQATFRATLTDVYNNPVAKQRVVIAVGPLTRQAVTDQYGVATVSIPLEAMPGDYTVRACFIGTPVYLPVSAVPVSFKITQQNTQLELTPEETSIQYSDPNQIMAVLEDITGKPIPEQTVFLVIIKHEGVNKVVEFSLPVITDYVGRAPLGPINLAPGDYTVEAYYNGKIPLPDDGMLELSDFRYINSFASGTLTVSTEEAALVYTSSAAIPMNTPVTLSATVNQDADGYPGDLTTSTVQFTIFNGGTTVVTTASAPVSANGIATTTLPGLPTGLYQVAVSLESGFFNAQTLSVPLAVYNPNPSIAAGIGVVNSLAGSANFIFYAYYPRGGNFPSGNVRINFNSGAQSFSSTSIDWLIIPSTSYAILKGSGTVNGVGDYGFLISLIAPSGGQQYIRLEIWNKATGSVIYDTQPGAPDYAEPTSPTTGLSIVWQ